MQKLACVLQTMLSELIVFEMHWLLCVCAQICLKTSSVCTGVSSHNLKGKTFIEDHEICPLIIITSNNNFL